MPSENIDDLIQDLYYHPEKHPSNTFNYYQRLEIPDYSSTTKVKKQYRWYSAPKWDPADKPEENQAFFAQEFNAIVEAYDVLSDKDRKLFYDAWLSTNETDKAFNRSAAGLSETVEQYSRIGRWYEFAGRGYLSFGLVMTLALGYSALTTIPDMRNQITVFAGSGLMAFEAGFAAYAYYHGYRQLKESGRLYRLASYYSDKDLSIRTRKYERALLKVGDAIGAVKNRLFGFCKTTGYG